MTTAPGVSRKKLLLKISGLLLAALIGWVVYDLYAPRTWSAARRSDDHS
jgi:hypothetical protein